MEGVYQAAASVQNAWLWIGSLGNSADQISEVTSTGPFKIKWLLFYGLVYALLHRFVSPVYHIYHTENKGGDHGGGQFAITYVYVSNFLYIWSITAVMAHLPTKAWFDMDLLDPVSMFFPLFMASFTTLWCIKFCILLTKKYIYSFKERLTFSRSLGESMHNSALVSLASVLHFSYCSSNTGGGPLKLLETLDGNDPMCFYVTSGADGYALPPLMVMWATGVIFVVLHLLVQRLSGHGLLSGGFVTDPSEEDESTGPPDDIQQPMVPWYSLFTSVTAVNLLISLKIFLGRFDMRTMQAALATAQSTIHKSDFPNTLYFDTHADTKGLWFDFMADCGDGFNSSYEIARLLAQPYLTISGNDGTTVLPRGQLLFIGGDLAYPHPEPDIYESRLFVPFEAAMPPPKHYDPRTISVNKPDLPAGVALKDYKGPQAFVIPGNHDWFDGLETFLRYICHRNWLGGWLMPQTRSYFAHKLCMGWWVFAIDNALSDDMDLFQYQYFAKVAESFGPSDCVVIMTHSPSWILDDYYSKQSEENLRHFMDTVLRGRVAARIAGDIHNYTRHEINEVISHKAARGRTRDERLGSDGSASSGGLKSSKSVYFAPLSKPTTASGLTRSTSFFHADDDDDNVDTPTLIVSGGGGAFLHPTHVPSSDSIYVGSDELEYARVASYPAESTCRLLAFHNLFQFRKKNWRFDVIGGALYFSLVLSVIPLCDVSKRFHAKDLTVGEQLTAFVATVVDVLFNLCDSSALSVVTALVVFGSAISFTDGNLSNARRTVLGSIHALCHYTCAVAVLVLVELALCYGKEAGVLGKGRIAFSMSMLEESFNILWPYITLADEYTGHIVQKILMTVPHVFDVPESLSLKRDAICTNPGGVVEAFRSLTIVQLVSYYFGMYLYYFILSVPVVSGVFGGYLWISVNFFNQHWNEAFSSLRIQDYKNFLRMNINSSGDIDVYVVGIDRVPRKWVGNPKWSGSKKRQFLEERDGKATSSHEWEEPSRWVPSDMDQSRFNTRIVDIFTITRPSGRLVPTAERLHRKTTSVPAGEGASVMSMPVSAAIAAGSPSKTVRMMEQDESLLGAAPQKAERKQSF